MLLNAFLDMLLTLGILLLAGAIAVTGAFIVFALALVIKGGMDELKTKKEEKHD